jgi:hypothetical protein
VEAPCGNACALQVSRSSGSPQLGLDRSDLRRAGEGRRATTVVNPTTPTRRRPGVLLSGETPQHGAGSRNASGGWRRRRHRLPLTPSLAVRWSSRPARRPCVVYTDDRGWSIYGAERAQPRATGGKWSTHEIDRIKPKPLRPVATGCRRDGMVRRGSTVRVRQRASSKAPQNVRLACPVRKRVISRALAGHRCCSHAVRTLDSASASLSRSFQSGDPPCPRDSAV